MVLMSVGSISSDTLVQAALCIWIKLGLEASRQCFGSIDLHSGPGFASCAREGPQDASRSLKALHLRPLGVEDLGQIGVEGIAPEEPFLGGLPLLGGRLVEVGDPLQRGDDVRAERLTIPDRAGPEEP